MDLSSLVGHRPGLSGKCLGMCVPCVYKFGSCFQGYVLLVDSYELFSDLYTLLLPHIGHYIDLPLPLWWPCSWMGGLAGSGQATGQAKHKRGQAQNDRQSIGNSYSAQERTIARAI